MNEQSAWSDPMAGSANFSLNKATAFRYQRYSSTPVRITQLTRSRGGRVGFSVSATASSRYQAYQHTRTQAAQAAWTATIFLADDG